MKRYICFITTFCAALCGVGAGVAASFALEAWRSVALGAVIAVLAFFAIPSHFAAQDRFFDKEAKRYDASVLNEPVLILTYKKTYKARICASKDTVVLLFRLKGRAIPMIFRKADAPALTYDDTQKVLSLRSDKTDRGACIASAPLLSNVENVYKTLKSNNW